jgi:hypothetical protein
MKLKKRWSTLTISSPVIAYFDDSLLELFLEAVDTGSLKSTPLVGTLGASLNWASGLSPNPVFSNDVHMSG